MEKKIIAILSIINVSLVILILTNWSYSIFDIDADNFESKLNPIYNLRIFFDHNLPAIDQKCFSITHRGLTPYGKNYGIKIKKRTDWTSIYGIWYVFEFALSDLQYSVLYKEKKSFYDKDLYYISLYPLEIRIDSKIQYNNALKIKEIITQLIKEDGYILKKSQFILGNDIVIKETESRFIIGVINRKYDDKEPSYGLYLNSYSKKRFFGMLPTLCK